MRATKSFVCQECGYDSPQWLGKCPECGSWNSLKEFQISNKRIQSVEKKEPKALTDIHYKQKQRLLTGFAEMDAVLGGGIVAGSVILLAGDPGIGKSTLLLQVGLKVSGQTPLAKVLYISGEESEEQVKLRAERLIKDKKSPENFLLLSSTYTDLTVQTIEQENPSLVIVDSIQTMESEYAGGLSGSVSQVRYATSQLVKIAKQMGIPIIIVGHVTKEGMVAGPMMLSHMVDVVLFLEGEKQSSNKLLRCLKNRFGPVDEVGVFVMDESGLSDAVLNSNLFVSTNSSLPGSILSIVLEGTRPFLVEVQALVVPSKLPVPRHVATGIDYKRLELLLAVLQKHGKVPLLGMDIFVNAAGGIKITDTAADLAVCLAIYSSYKNLVLGSTVGIGEVGLLGELRKTSHSLKRQKEAQKLGYKHIYSAQNFATLPEVLKNV